MSKDTSRMLTVLTTLGVSAVKTYRKKAGKVVVEGYGRAKTFTQRHIEIDRKGEWLRRLGRKQHSFVVLGEPVNWKPGDRKRRLSTQRDGADPTLEDVPRLWMPIDIDNIDFEPTLDGFDEGESFAFDVLDRLGLRGVSCTWHLTGSHGFFGKHRVRLWIELAEPATCAEMKAYAKGRWGDEKVEVGGEQKNLVDFSVYQPQQPIYTGDPMLEDGIGNPVTRRVGHIKGEPLAIEALPRKKGERRKAGGQDENIRKLRDCGLYIERLKPGQHCIECPWEEMHSGERRKDDTFYFEPNYNGHDIPAFKCHHDSCDGKKWDDVLEWMGETPGWVYVKRLHQFRDPRDGEMVDIATYAAERKWGNDKQVVKRFLREGGEAVDRVEFLPGEPRVSVRADGVRVLNTYIDRRIEPDFDMEQTQWTEQLEFLLPDERERGLLCDWMAHAYQHPDKKIRWAPVLFGPQGTGKTSVLAALGACIGADYEHIPTSDELKDKFTGWCEGMLLARIEELMSGEGRYEIANRLKPVITDDAVSVRRMRREGVKVRNFVNVCASTNHIDSIPIEGGDRRYAVFRTFSDEAEIPKHTARLKKLNRWLEAGGLRAVAAWLASRDVSSFDYAGRAPDTEIKSGMQDASGTRLTNARDIAQGLKDFDVITSSMLIAYLAKHDCDYDEWRIGHVPTALGWMPMTQVYKTRRNRIWVGEKQQAVWSPTRSREALKEFDRMSREQRNRVVDAFMDKWINANNGPPRAGFRVVKGGATDEHSASAGAPDDE